MHAVECDAFIGHAYHQTLRSEEQQVMQRSTTVKPLPIQPFQQLRRTKDRPTPPFHLISSSRLLDLTQTLAALSSLALPSPRKCDHAGSPSVLSWDPSLQQHLHGTPPRTAPPRRSTPRSSAPTKRMPYLEKKRRGDKYVHTINSDMLRGLPSSKYSA